MRRFYIGILLGILVITWSPVTSIGVQGASPNVFFEEDSVNLDKNTSQVKVAVDISSDEAYFGAELGFNLPDGITIEEVEGGEDQEGSLIGPKEDDGLYYVGFFSGSNRYQDTQQVLVITFEVEGSGVVSIDSATLSRFTGDHEAEKIKMSVGGSLALSIEESDDDGQDDNNDSDDGSGSTSSSSSSSVKSSVSNVSTNDNQETIEEEAVAQEGVNAYSLSGSSVNGILTGRISREIIENLISVDDPFIFSLETEATSYDFVIEEEALSALKDSQGGLIELLTPLGMVSVAEETLEQFSSVSDTLTVSIGSDQEKGQYVLQIIEDGETVDEWLGYVDLYLYDEGNEQEESTSSVMYMMEEGDKGDPIPWSYEDSEDGVFYARLDHSGNYEIENVTQAFTDVDADRWSYDAINYLGSHGISEGVGSQEFAPTQNMTRAQVLVMAMRAYDLLPDELEESVIDDNFSDAKGSYYSMYVAEAKAMGWINGTGGNLFEPDKEITREETAKLLYTLILAKDASESAEETSGQLKIYEDASTVDDWAQEALSYMVEEGLMQGNAMMLRPRDTMTREEMAQLIYNIVQESEIKHQDLF